MRDSESLEKRKGRISGLFFCAQITLVTGDIRLGFQLLAISREVLLTGT